MTQPKARFQVIAKEGMFSEDHIVKAAGHSSNAMDAQYDNELLRSTIQNIYRRLIEPEYELIGFTISSPYQTDSLDWFRGFIADLCEVLEDQDDVHCVTKFSDDSEIPVMSNYRLEIYGVEMKLREILTCIFVETYGQPQSYDLLAMHEVQVKGKKKSEEERFRKRCREYYENEFFHIDFQGYIKLPEYSKLHWEGLTSILEIASNFDDFQSRICKRGIRKNSFISFLAEVKILLDSVACVRNAVMHNRRVTPNEIENYRDAMNNLEALMKRFEEEHFQ